MASKNFAVLDLGSQKATLAYFEGEGEKILKAIATEKVEFGKLVGPTKQTTLRQLISSLAGQVNLPAKSAIRYSVPSQSVFVRFAKVSGLGEDLKQLAGYELQQQLPVPMDQVEWDYHVMPSNSVEQQVALVAARKNDIDDLYEAIHSVGFNPVAANVSSIASLNALFDRYSTNDFTGLMIEIREKTTNLIYTFGEAFYLRTINFGATSLIAEISKNLGLSMEHSAAWVAASQIEFEGNEGSNEDPTAQAVGSYLRAGLDRLIPQIVQTSSYFQSHFHGHAPAQVFVAGELTEVVNIREYFQQKLAVPVEYFTPSTIDRVEIELDPVLHGFQGQKLSAIYGLASQESGTAFVQSELLPSIVKNDNVFSKEKPLYFIASALMLIGALALVFGLVSKTGELNEKVAEFQPTLDELEKLDSDIGRALQEVSKIETANEPIADHYLRRDKMVRLVDQMSQLFAKDEIWISDFAFLVGHDYSESAAGPGVDVFLEDLKEIGGGRSFLKVQEEEDSRSRDVKQIDVLRVRGFWVENENGQDIVLEVLDRIESECPDLTLSVEEGRRSQKETVRLEDSQLIRKLENPTSHPDQSSWAFEIIIPLKKALDL